MKKTILCAVLGSAWLASPSIAGPSSTTELLRTFASCAGRLSALEEQQRMFDGAASEVTAETLTAFEGMLDALLPIAMEQQITGRDILNWRVDAKMAQAVLLQTAKFGTQTQRQDRARKIADEYIATCSGLLLGA